MTSLEWRGEVRPHWLLRDALPEIGWDSAPSYLQGVHSWGVHLDALAYSPEPVTIKVIYKYVVFEISIALQIA